MKKELRIRTTVLPGDRIEIVDQYLPMGQDVDLVVTHESKDEGPSIMDILNSGPERRLFQTAEEVKAYLAEEKASWKR